MWTLYLAGALLAAFMVGGGYLVRQKTAEEEKKRSSENGGEVGAANVASEEDEKELRKKYGDRGHMEVKAASAQSSRHDYDAPRTVGTELGMVRLYRVTLGDIQRAVQVSRTNIFGRSVENETVSLVFDPLSMQKPHIEAFIQALVENNEARKERMAEAERQALKDPREQ